MGGWGGKVPIQQASNASEGCGIGGEEWDVSVDAERGGGECEWGRKRAREGDERERDREVEGGTEGER